jgi:hypothetical protein
MKGNAWAELAELEWALGCIDLSQQAELNAEARTKSAHTSTEKSATQSQRQLAIDKANVWV